MKICKECNQKYFKKDYHRHMHGKNHHRYGAVLSETHIRAVVKSRKGIVVSEETKRKMSIAAIGKIFSEQTRQRLSIAKIGKNNYMYGKQHTENSKLKISQSTRKRWKDGTYNHNPIGSSKKGLRKDIGHFVRSTWEANFARILNYCGISYEYELKRFDLGYATYLPDFYLFEKDMYIEIKGYDTKEAKQKRIMTRKIHKVKIKVIKLEKYNQLQNTYKKLILNWE